MQDLILQVINKPEAVLSGPHGEMLAVAEVQPAK